MADGRWVMTNDELNNVVCSMNEKTIDKLPNYGKHRSVRNNDETSERKCAFCESTHLAGGFGGYGPDYQYKSFRCEDCGGVTDFYY